MSGRGRATSIQRKTRQPAASRRADRAVALPAPVVLDGELVIPPILDLEEFREWALSDEFPESGRIDYVDGCIEVDMSPDNLFLHTSAKSEVARVIGNRIRETQFGHLFIDNTRISSPAANVSSEPDIVVIGFETISTERVKLTPTKRKRPDSFIEIEGPPDLVVEVVSDSSVEKDSQRLFQAYAAAGIPEYWLVDARGPRLQFTIYRCTSKGYVKTKRDRDGFQRSRILNARYRLERERARDGNWIYDLIEGA